MARTTHTRAEDRSSRESFVASTADLLRRQGYAATGLNQIVAASGAPKGSLYFHFPAGKEQLAAEAMERAGSRLRDSIAAALKSDRDLARSLTALIDALGAGLAASGYRDGCPIATVTLERAADSEELRRAAERVLESWLEVLRERLIEAGLEAPAAGRRALFILSALEGALMLARAQRDLGPLQAVRAELVALAT